MIYGARGRAVECRMDGRTVPESSKATEMTDTRKRRPSDKEKEVWLWSG